MERNQKVPRRIQDAQQTLETSEDGSSGWLAVSDPVLFWNPLLNLLAAEPRVTDWHGGLGRVTNLISPAHYRRYIRID